jgi:hypothetical protein
MGQMQPGGPPSHKEWTARLHSGNGIENAGNLLVSLETRRLPATAFRSKGQDQSVRLKSGVAMRSVPMPKTKRNNRSY